METLEDMRRWITESAERIGKSFTEPDDDWAMAMFIQTPGSVNILPLENEWFRNGISKQLLSEILKHVVAEYGTIRYGILLNTYSLVIDAPDGEMPEDDENFMGQVRTEQVRISDHPRSRETLMLILGDAESEQEWHCFIDRYENKPPTLTPWEQMQGGRSTGKFVGLNQYL